MEVTTQEIKQGHLRQKSSEKQHSRVSDNCFLSLHFLTVSLVSCCNLFSIAVIKTMTKISEGN